MPRDGPGNGYNSTTPGKHGNPNGRSPRTLWADKQMVVIGLGSGRSGTASLSKLINEQPNSICFHELNPACVCYEGTPQPILNTVREFRDIVNGGDPRYLTVDMSRSVSSARYDTLKKMPKVDLIGDIAHYYLRYVDEIAAIDPQVRFICLQRDRAQTIDSWQRRMAIQRWPAKKISDRLASWITGEPYHTSRNPWIEHDGSRWATDPVWDKCYPKYPARDLPEAIGMYWDDYYARAEVLADRYPDTFVIIPTEELNTPQTQQRVLDFLDRPADHRVIVDAHVRHSA